MGESNGFQGGLSWLGLKVLSDGQVLDERSRLHRGTG